MKVTISNNNVRWQLGYFIFWPVLYVLTWFITINHVYADEVDTALFGDNSRYSIDSSTRITRNLDQNNNAFMHVVGLDLHKVISSATYDIGTLVFQPYIVKINNVNNPSAVFDDGNDTQLTWRIANFNYTALSQGKFNIKVGHLEIPFGLEYQIDTNGTLRQLTAADRGIKTDWGLSLNGILANVEYEVALTRGSGQEIKSTGDPYVFSGRVGSNSTKNFSTGVSWLVGEVLGKNGTVKHKKVAIDANYFYLQWQFMFEASAGKQANNNRQNIFVESVWKNATETLSSYWQLGYKNTKINAGTTHVNVSNSYWVTGIQWQSSAGIDISAQYKDAFTNSSSQDARVSVQLRYRM